MSYEEDRAGRNELREVDEGLKEAPAARKASYIPGPVYLLAWAAWHAYLLVNYRTTARALDLGSERFLPVLGWVALIAVVSGPVLYWLSRVVTTTLFRRITGVEYWNDIWAYARAGGYDLDRWPRLISEIGVFYLYLLAHRAGQEAVLLNRSVGAYIGSFVVVALVLEAVLTAIAFYVYDRRH